MSRGASKSDPVRSKKRAFEGALAGSKQHKKTKLSKQPKAPVLPDEDEFEEASDLESEAPDVPESTLPQRQLTKAEELKKAKKQKRKEKKAAVFNEDNFDEERGINLSIGQMDGQMLVDYVAKYTKRFEPELSTVELEDRRISPLSILDTTSWEETRDLDHLPAFLESLTEADLKEAPGEPGSPHTIVVASAGLRAADTTRALRKFQTQNGTVAKLFAKHIKLKESIELCKKKRMNFGVGTPQRLIDLLQDGALSAKRLERIVLDASHIDIKKRGILEMKDTHTPVVKLLNLPVLRERFGTDKRTSLVFY